MVLEGKNQVNRITLVNMFICALDYLLQNYTSSIGAIVTSFMENCFQCELS